MTDLLIILAGIAAIFWLKRSGTKPEIKKEKASDWLQVQSVDEDGFIVTEDFRYMLVLEVQPVPFSLKSPVEQQVIWHAFRDWINMLPHPVRWRSETHPYNLEEYFQDLRALALESGREEDVAYVAEMRDTFMQMIEEQRIQDRRYYIFLETDHRYLSDASIATTNLFINELLKKRGRNDQENREIAKQELMNSLRITQSVFGNVGIWVRKLNRNEVMDMLRGSVNRELASLVPFRVEPVAERMGSLGKIQFERGQEDEMVQAEEIHKAGTPERIFA